MKTDYVSPQGQQWWGYPRAVTALGFLPVVTFIFFLELTLFQRF